MGTVVDMLEAVSTAPDTLVCIVQALYALSVDAEAAASADYTLFKTVELHGVIDDVIINKADWRFLVFMDSKYRVYSQQGELMCQIMEDKA